MVASENQYEIQKTEQEWQEALTPEQYRVLRKHGTERAGTSPLDKVYEEGTYFCAGCGQRYNCRSLFIYDENRSSLRSLWWTSGSCV